MGRDIEFVVKGASMQGSDLMFKTFKVKMNAERGQNKTLLDIPLLDIPSNT